MKLLLRGWIYSILAKAPWGILRLVSYLKFKVVLSRTDAGYLATDKNSKIEFLYLIRGFERYLKGLTPFYNILLENYCVSDLIFESDDVVVDIGANIGEFSLAVLNKNRDVSIVALEPSPKEYEFLVNNLKSARANTLNIGAWNKPDSLTFYSKGETADNSLFEFKGYTRKSEVKLDTLNNVLKDTDTIKLLKIEAEGGEIEVLKGQESFRIKSFVESNVWGLFKDGQTKFKKGELIECYSPIGPNMIFK